MQVVSLHFGYMNADNKPFLNWFGYSRKERRSTFILLIVLLILIAYRYLLPLRDAGIEDIPLLIESTDTMKIFSLNSGRDSTCLFSFDPNTTPYDSLTELGLSGKQASTLISYRNNGGRFRKPSDIKKIYGIDDETADLLMPYINIKSERSTNRKMKSDSIYFNEQSVMIDLNLTDSAELEALPGLGPVLSSRIIKYRKLLGGFVSVEQLKEVYGLTEATYKIVEDRVNADSFAVRGIEVNNSAFTEHIRHPYLEQYDIIAILKYKEINGKILDINVLIENKILTEAKAKRISPYLKF